MDTKSTSLWHNLTKKKPIEKSADQSSTRLQLAWYHLLAYGISATLGSGIYSVVGTVAKNWTGPAVVFSILMSGTLSLLTALCYLELSALIPANGVGYVYGYSSMGELMGWILGWMSILEYAFAGSVTAVSISNNLVSLAKHVQIPIHTWIYCIPLGNGVLDINLLSLLLVLLVMVVVLKGLEFSARLNGLFTGFNCSLLCFIILVGSSFVSKENWTPFFPYPTNQILHGSATMIYSYIGFDTVCNLCPNAKSKTHLKIAVLGTVLVTTIVYVAVGFVLTGMVPLKDIDVETALASSFSSVGVDWMAHVVKFCSICMMGSTLLACLIGQPEILSVMSKDGLLPGIFHWSQDGIQRWNVAISCGVSGIVAAAVPLESLVDLISLGTLVGFALNAMGLIVLQCSQVSNTRGILFCILYVFGCMASSFGLYFGQTFVLLIPMILTVGSFIGLIWIFYQTSTLAVYRLIVPGLVIAGNSLVIPSMAPQTFVQLGLWVMAGLGVYSIYGYRNSRIRRHAIFL